MASRPAFPFGRKFSQAPCHAAFGDISANVLRKIQMGARFTAPYYSVYMKLIAKTKAIAYGSWLNFLNPFT
eukprot:2876076-Rhodomonas_salina.2